MAKEHFCTKCGSLFENCLCRVSGSPNTPVETTEMYCTKCIKAQEDCNCRAPMYATRIMVEPPPAPGLSAGAQPEFLVKLANLPLPDPKRENRIEALRAATRLVVATFESVSKTSSSGLVVNEAVLDVAEQFAKWLETGER